GCARQKSRANGLRREYASSHKYLIILNFYEFAKNLKNSLNRGEPFVPCARHMVVSALLTPRSDRRARPPFHPPRPSHPPARQSPDRRAGPPVWATPFRPIRRDNPRE